MSGVKIDDQIRKLVKVAEDADWVVTVTRNHRLKFTDADGNQVAVSPMQCGSSRVLDNLKAHLRRGGLVLPEDDGRAKKQVVVAEMVEVDLPIEDITPMQALEVLMEFVTNEESAKDLATIRQTERLLDEARMEIEDLKTSLRKAENSVVSQRRLVEEIRKAFTMQAWEILPAIGRLVGIEMGS